MNLIDRNITTWNNLQVNFWGITKCANTSIRMHLFSLEKNLELDLEKKFRDKGHLWLKEVGIVDQLISIDQAFSNKLKNFCVIRNPIERFKSMYKDLFMMRKNRGKKAKINTDLTPYEFAFWLQDKLDEDLDVHFRSQWHWIKDYPDILKIKLENLEEEWPFTFQKPTLRVHTTDNYKIVLDKKTVALLKIRYKVDFETLGYSE